MKKLIYSLICAASALLVVSCMGVDNFDAPIAISMGRL